MIEKKVQLDLGPWIGKALDDGLSTDQALTELRARPVPWKPGDVKTALKVEAKLRRR